MCVWSTILRLAGKMPEGDGYGEVVEVWQVPAGEATNGAILMSHWGCDVRLEGAMLGQSVSERVVAALEVHGVDTGGLLVDPGFDGYRDLVVTTASSRCVFGQFERHRRSSQLRWTKASAKEIAEADIALLDPCFAEGSRQAARICHGTGTPYVTLDCAPDDLLHGHAAATVISREFALGGCPAQSVMDTLARYAPASSGLTVVTDGARPVVFARAGKVPREVQVPPVDAVSCIGAGDSFRAGIAYGLLREWDDERTVAFAVKVAGAVCSNGPVAASPPALA